MIHRITGTHIFLDGFGAALWLDVNPKEKTQRSDIENRVNESLEKLELSNVMSLSHRRIYDQWVFVLNYRSIFCIRHVVYWNGRAGLVPRFELVHKEYCEEENLQWRRLRQWSQQNNIPCVDDEDGLTLGMGKTSRTWSLDSLPLVDTLSANQFGRIPAVYITGTNGKTTTSRMLSAICQHDDQLVASDKHLLMGFESTENGLREDWTGPGVCSNDSTRSPC